MKFERRPSYPEWRDCELYPPWKPIPGVHQPQWRFKDGALELRGHARGGEDIYRYGEQPMFRLPLEVADYVMRHMKQGQTSPWGVTVFIAANGLVYAFPPTPGFRLPGLPPREPSLDVVFTMERPS